MEIQQKEHYNFIIENHKTKAYFCCINCMRKYIKGDVKKPKAYDLSKGWPM